MGREWRVASRETSDGGEVLAQGHRGCRSGEVLRPGRERYLLHLGCHKANHGRFRAGERVPVGPRAVRPSCPDADP